MNNEADKDNPDAFYVSERMYKIYVHTGSRLRNLHLLREDKEAQLAIEAADPADMVIGKVKYADGWLHINATTRIGAILEPVWNYRIGGYQVLDKWFKSHRGEVFDEEKYTHICKVVFALEMTTVYQETLRGMHEEHETDQ